MASSKPSPDDIARAAKATRGDSVPPPILVRQPMNDVVLVDDPRRQLAASLLPYYLKKRPDDDERGAIESAIRTSGLFFDAWDETLLKAEAKAEPEAKAEKAG